MLDNEGFHCGAVSLVDNLEEFSLKDTLLPVLSLCLLLSFFLSHLLTNWHKMCFFVCFPFKCFFPPKNSLTLNARIGPCTISPQSCMPRSGNIFAATTQQKYNKSFVSHSNLSARCWMAVKRVKFNFRGFYTTSQFSSSSTQEPENVNFNWVF